MAVVPAGQTRCVPAGQTVTVSEVDLKKEASLIVCGTLVIRGDFSPNTNGASFWVAPGGVVTVQGNTNLNAWVNIYNFGTFSASNLNLNGGNAAFWNVGTGAQVNVSGTINVNAATQFINHQGIVSANQLTLNGNATACLSEGACISVNSFTSNGNGAIQVTGSAPVALSFTGTATLNSQVTSSSLLYVCQAPGATANNPANWGAAQVTQNCTSGCGVLPAKILTLKARREGHQIVLTWRCSLPCLRFQVKVLLEEGGVVLWEGAGTALAMAEEELPKQRGWTFEVVALGSAGQELARATASLPAGKDLTLKLFPSLFAESLTSTWDGEEPLRLHWFSAAGQEVGQVEIGPGVTTFQTLGNGVALASLPKGAYLVRATLPSGHPLGTFTLLKTE